MLNFDMKEFIDSFSFMSNINDVLDVTSKSLEIKFSNVVTLEFVDSLKQNAIASVNSLFDLTLDDKKTEGGQ